MFDMRNTNFFDMRANRKARRNNSPRIDARAAMWLPSFLLNVFVRRAKRLMLIRIVRSCRSAWLVEIYRTRIVKYGGNQAARKRRQPSAVLEPESCPTRLANRVQLPTDGHRAYAVFHEKYQLMQPLIYGHVQQNHVQISGSMKLNACREWT